jgi:hypothetical protein
MTILNCTDSLISGLNKMTAKLGGDRRLHFVTNLGADLCRKRFGR